MVLININTQIELNNKNSTWQRLELETSLRVLSSLLFEWLETLKGPVLDMETLSQIVIRGSRPKQCLQKFDVCKRYILEYLLRFVSRLRPMTMDTQCLVIKRIMASLTHQKVRVKQILMPSGIIKCFDEVYIKLNSLLAYYYGYKIDFFFFFQENTSKHCAAEQLVNYWISSYDF